MVDKGVDQEKPIKRWSRSKEMLRIITVASLLARFIDDNLTAHGLVDVLDEMERFRVVCGSDTLPDLRDLYKRAKKKRA